MGIVTKQKPQSGVIAVDHPERLAAMVQAIEADDVMGLKENLKALGGASLSDPEVRIRLPKQWNRPVLTTPLRTAITWHNVTATSLILSSKCVVTAADKMVSLEKIMRHVKSGDDVTIIGLLIDSGASIQSPIPLKQLFQEFLISDEQLCRRVAELVSQSHADNDLKGQALLSVSYSVKNTQISAQQMDHVDHKKDTFARDVVRMVMMSTFDPCSFLTKVSNWSELSTATLQRLMNLVPLFLQVMRRCPDDIIGGLLRHAGSHMTRVPSDTKVLLGRVGFLLAQKGYNVKRVLSRACLSPYVMSIYGFSRPSAKAPVQPMSLQRWCTVAIQDSLRPGHHSDTVARLPLPRALHPFVLLTDIFPLPWEDNNQKYLDLKGQTMDLA